MPREDDCPVGVVIPHGPIANTATRSLQIEAAGAGSIWVPDLDHDAFLQATVAATSGVKCRVATGVGIALSRNPFSVALMAHDLQNLTDNRFLLGLGSQIRAHIQKRFAMPWSGGVPQVEDFVRAVRSIMTSWEEGSRVNYRGPFYRVTFCPPNFTPTPPTPPPPIILGGQGPMLLRAAGRVADGYATHPFSCQHTIESHVLPHLSSGVEEAGRTLSEVPITQHLMVCVGSTEEELSAAITAGKRDIAFHASTPSYVHVLAQHGWGDLQPTLEDHAMRRAWGPLVDALPDEVFNEFAVTGSPDRLPALVTARISPRSTRVVLFVMGDLDDYTVLSDTIAAVRDNLTRRSPTAQPDSP